jgi:hypothetical protein
MSDAGARRTPVVGLGSSPPRQGSLAATAQAVADALADDHGSSDQLGVALTLAASLRAEVELAEARLITKARAAGKTWAEIADLLGLRSKQAAEQRYLRRMRTGARDHGVTPTGQVDADQRATVSSPRPTARRNEPVEVPARGDSSAHAVNNPLTLGTAERTEAAGRPGSGAVARSAARQASGEKPAREPVIREDSTYQLARLGEGRWAVMVDGEKAGTIRRQYEPRARRMAAWEPVTLVGNPVRCLGPHATKSGYARTRDAAAAELLGHIVRRQREARKRRRAGRVSKALARAVRAPD